jgi:hypothetical protein
MRALSRSLTASLRAEGSRARAAVSLLATVLALLGWAPAPAAAAAGTRTIAYRGERLSVPASWPVFNLARTPRTCVRFDRHAVYLGQPSTEQQCPSAALGRTEAILIQPLGPAAEHSALAPRAPQAGAEPLGGSMAVLRERSRGVLITATWGRDPGLMRRALHDQALGRRQQQVGGVRTVRSGAPAPRRRAGASSSADSAHAASASTYTGPGFDACSAPSASQLSAWQSSPFRAYGIYIGGANMACAQSNLSASYVSQEVAAGWHLIPTYVGLQAPDNSCGCAAISPSQASAEGTAAAQDAVSDAQALGIETGNPIYFDMEAYGRTSATTQTVLKFLAAWTAELHAEGYLSGVYVADGSGVPDLVSQWGTGYLEPDDLWIASWNGQESTYDSEVPSSEWAAHQRIHQYRGAHNDDYGGVTMNIDSDYVDAATVGAGGVVAAPGSSPTLSITPQSTGAITLRASWTGEAGIAGWRLYGGDSPGSLEPLTEVLPGGLFDSRDELAYFAAQALNSEGQVLGLSAATPTPAHLVIYGASVFVPAHAGPAGIPVACFSAAICHLRARITAGRTVIATTGPQRFSYGRGGFLDFTPSAASRQMLDNARTRRLPVVVQVTDSSGVKASTRMNLIPFSAGGRAVARSFSPSATLRTVGLTDFVSSAGTGGILTACTQPASCAVQARISVGRTTIASTGRELIGAHQLGYVMFRLSPHGRALLAAAAGNQLAAQVTLSDATGSARARVALVAFS